MDTAMYTGECHVKPEAETEVKPRSTPMASEHQKLGRPGMDSLSLPWETPWPGLPAPRPGETPLPSSGSPPSRRVTKLLWCRARESCLGPQLAPWLPPSSPSLHLSCRPFRPTTFPNTSQPYSSAPPGQSSCSAPAPCSSAPVTPPRMALLPTQLLCSPAHQGRWSLSS